MLWQGGGCHLHVLLQFWSFLFFNTYFSKIKGRLIDISEVYIRQGKCHVGGDHLMGED